MFEMLKKSFYFEAVLANYVYTIIRLLSVGTFYTLVSWQVSQMADFMLKVDIIP